MTVPDGQDALSALDRLVHRHKLLSPEQGVIAGRLITGDADFKLLSTAPPPVAPQAAAELAADKASSPESEKP